MRLMGKRSKIVKYASVFSGLESELADLPGEFSDAYWFFLLCPYVDVLAVSSHTLREQLGREGIRPTVGRLSSFDILQVLDEIQQEDKEIYGCCTEAICDILGIEDIWLKVTEMQAPDQKQESGAHRVRACFVKSRGRYAPLQEFSDGTLTVLAVVLSMLDCTRFSPLLCVEELENSLHPLAIEKLLRFLQENASRKPVLITTHSPYLLNGVDPDDVIVAVADESGATHFEKPSNRKAINTLLKRGYMSFGDLLATNFKDVL